MNLTNALSALALAAMLPACAVAPPDDAPIPTAATAPAPMPDRSGAGTVESASVASLSSAPSAAAGGTAGAATSPTMAYRVRMADGTTRDVVQAGERFAVGDRVELTGDGRLIRP